MFLNLAVANLRSSVPSVSWQMGSEDGDEAVDVRRSAVERSRRMPTAFIVDFGRKR
jgi:hypothetical protein